MLDIITAYYRMINFGENMMILVLESLLNQTLNRNVMEVHSFQMNGVQEQVLTLMSLFTKKLSRIQFKYCLKNKTSLNKLLNTMKSKFIIALKIIANYGLTIIILWLRLNYYNQKQENTLLILCVNFYKAHQNAQIKYR